MKIIVFPVSSNPYQKLLYDHFPPAASIRYLTEHFSLYPKSFIGFLLKLRRLRGQGYSIFHLHWLFFLPVYSGNMLVTLLGRTMNTLYLVVLLAVLKLLQYKLVWTVHNLLPHDTHTLNDLVCTKMLLASANKLIVHSSSTAREVKALGVPAAKIEIIPVGSYQNVYPNSITKVAARKNLEIPADRFVFLFFGMIRSYKGLADLLPAFAKVAATKPNVLLYIAGACTDPTLIKLIEKYKNELGEKLMVKLQRIEDAEVQDYFNACDISVFPFRKTTTTSSVLTSFAFGRSSIYPLMGNLKDMPPDVGLSYKANQPGELEKGLLQAVEHKEALHDLEKHATAYIKTLSWQDIATRTYKVFQELNSVNS